MVLPMCVCMRTEAVLSVMKSDSVCVNCGCRLSVVILYLSPVSQTLSNAFETSRRIMSVLCFCAMFIDNVSCSVASAVFVPLFLRNPCCLVFIMLCVSRWLFSLLLRILSKILPCVSKSDIGL